MELNKAFFGLYENWFLVTKEELLKDANVGPNTRHYGLRILQ